ncbi:hypothetical protein FG476_03090 [Xylella fastidiosa subsp. multiplex]|uniref:Uncharacterized protein n=1 Tax=Xylella fastidiosa subsp. multiplex TaxID=644357 RepID=A0A9Q4MGL0_XYLFS|nr:hypothetical protein Xfasm12_0583 [Xylella fastidiosa M12]MRT33780.1 hypothetical protein [Xylella fastidiosa subsp. multiplex]MRT45469.1 hypothetical protein [Xylella fastidiosa subsp. multiplex]MRT52594.1 hypothetical protein [Xylella fastidiosa subsp. multiplex]MRT95667.1 hypothetical protein [Xylella fastidiosa subsp. multiplex]
MHVLLSWGAVRCFCACRVFATITLGWLYIFPSDSHTARQVQEPMLNGRIALCSVSSSTLMFHHLRFHLCHVQNGSASACLITDADFSALPTCWLCGVIQRPRSISVKLRKKRSCGFNQLCLVRARRAVYSFLRGASHLALHLP